MNFALSVEQELLRDAARHALARIDSVAAARAARDGAPLPDLWPTAREAGWTGLLVGEEHGGAGLDVFDAMLVLEECGRRLNGAGLIGHLTATRLLSRTGASDVLLQSLAAGEIRASIVLADPLNLKGPGPFRLSGAANFQLDVEGADVLVVPVSHDGAVRAALVTADASGLEIEPTPRGDASRPIARVAFDDVPATLLDAGADDLADAWDVAQALLAADALGVSEAALAMGVAYAKERHTFGRPIGSYQAIKHQLVEILRHVETTRSLCYYVGYAAEARPAEFRLASACARFAGEQASTYATRTCIAVHGGIGATWEHDAPLYWRRAQLSRLLAGGISGAGDRVASEITALSRDRTPRG